MARGMGHLLGLFICMGVASAAQNFPVPFSTTYFGFDGPWQAISAQVGGWDPLDPTNENATYVYVDPSEQNTVNLYPGGFYSDWVMSSTACQQYNSYDCGVGGFWTQVPTTTDIDYPPGYGGPDITGTGTLYRNAMTLGGQSGQTLTNLSIAVLDNGTVTNPDGTTRGFDLGFLSLGADQQQQVFTLDVEEGTAIDAWTFPGRLYNNSVIPSYSFALHIGSAAYNYPGSLVYGGYDKGRMLGPATTWNTLPGSSDPALNLLDIGIGVETGASPFSFTSKDQLLLTNTSTHQSMQVNPDSTVPYMYLPRETCDEIVSDLPVTFDSTSGYYLWNISSPNYTTVVTSPAYLSFSFPPAPGTSNNVVVKMPFSLLNLTLMPPLVSEPKQYFPCMPYNPDNGVMTLGRAFLQAAIWGKNFNRGTFWLGQASGPGPILAGMGTDYTDIADNQTTFAGYDLSQYSYTWSNHWKPLTASSTSGDTGSGGMGSSSGSGLSTGAKAGIGVGVAVGALALIALIVFLVLRRRKGDSEKAPSTAPLHPGKEEYPMNWQGGHNPHYSNATTLGPQEMYTPHSSFPPRSENTTMYSPNTQSSGVHEMSSYN